MLDQNLLAQAIAHFINTNANNGVMFTTLYQQAALNQFNNVTFQKLVQNGLSIVPVIAAGNPQFTYNPNELATAVAAVTCQISAASAIEKTPHLQTSMTPQERADWGAFIQLRGQIDAATNPPAPAYSQPGYQPAAAYQPRAVAPAALQNYSNQPVTQSLPQNTLQVKQVVAPVQAVAPVQTQVTPTVQQQEFVQLEQAPMDKVQVAPLAVPLKDGIKKVRVWATPEHKTYVEQIIEVPGMKYTDHVDPSNDQLGVGAAFEDAKTKADRFWPNVLKGKSISIDSLPLNPADGKLEDYDVAHFPEINDYMSLGQALNSFRIRQFMARTKHRSIHEVPATFTYRGLQLIHALGDDSINSEDQTTAHAAVAMNAQLKAYFDYGVHLEEHDPGMFAGFLKLSTVSTCPIERAIAQDVNVRATQAFNNYRKYVVGDDSFQISNFLEDAEEAIELLRKFAKDTYGANWNTVVPITAHMKQLVRRHCNYIKLTNEEADNVFQQVPVHEREGLESVCYNSVWRSQYTTVGYLPLTSVETGMYFDAATVLITRNDFPEIHAYLGGLLKVGTGELERMPHRRIVVTSDFNVFEIIAANKNRQSKETEYVLTSRGQVF